MARSIKMYALKPFPFNGVVLEVDAEFEPDTKAQGDLLKTIGHATYRKPAYNNRAAHVTNRAVMTTDPSAGQQPTPVS